MEVYFLKPIPRSNIWGGTKLQEYFNYEGFKDDVGHVLNASANQKDASLILNGEFQNKTLYDLWQEHPEYFNSQYEIFPFIIGFLAPTADLSIQIHPGNQKAKELGFPFGKNEAWYFLEVEDNTELVAGINVANEKDLRLLINEDKWDELFGPLGSSEG